VECFFLIRVLSLIVAIAGIAFMASLAASWAGANPQAATYPRAQALITSGSLWGPPAGFNPYFTNYATGTVGLCNETLQRYDPLKDAYINWLAKSAKFTKKKTYTVVVRRGIKWSNGQKFTGKDVAFNFKLGRFSTAFWNDLYGNLKSIRAKGLTVTFKFKGTPNYVQWQNLVWNLPMVNRGQARTITSAASLEAFGQQVPIGTGPYEFDPVGYDPEVRVVWKKKAVWWAAQQKLAPSPKPKFVIDIWSHSNLNGLSPILSKVYDLENTYLPGVTDYVKSGDMHTYFPKAPYNLSAGTSWLEVNTTKPALNNKAFRKALATSININQIVAYDYGNTVLPANATGLLPTWKKWVDQKQLKALGFTYSTDKAKALLAAAGYKDVNGDGYVETPGGAVIDLKIGVPWGWADWESARDMIIASAKNAGIRLHKDEGDFNHWQSERNSGAFDLVVDNNYQLSDSPWTYYNGIFHLPVKARCLGTRQAAQQNAAEQCRQAQGADEEDAEDHSDRASDHSALVQRRLGAVEVQVLEELALVDLEAELLPLYVAGLHADDRDRHDHAPEARLNSRRRPGGDTTDRSHTVRLDTARVWESSRRDTNVR
jgi:peptide/nickel transport system substrate-binding protein